MVYAVSCYGISESVEGDRPKGPKERYTFSRKSLIFNALKS